MGANGGDPSFPLRAACVDMGSNAIRFVVAEFASEREYVLLVNDRQPVRLGHGVYLSGRLDPHAMEAAVQAMVGFKAEMDRLGVVHARAVATSALRESSNRGDLIDAVHRETGLALEVISGSEEARLVHLAVASRVPLGDRKWLLVDVGGGSVEVSLVDQHGILWSESHTMGAVRLLEVLTESGEQPGRFLRLLEEYVATLRIPSASGGERVAGYVATGGNIEALAKLAGEPDEVGVSTVPLERLRAVIEQLARLSFRQRVEQLGLREDRADVILPGALLYERLGLLAGVAEVLVPHVGIKDGVVLDLVARLSRRPDHRDRQDRETEAGALSLGRKYLFDEGHARQVARLALSLYDQLRALHGLGEADRRILHAAALLHDIGQFVSYRSHHKHSWYLISHSELAGFSYHEMQLVANVARYHRKGEPSGHHPTFTAFAPEERRRVRAASALLRIADALDREHRAKVRGVRVKMGPSELTLWLEGSGDLLLEGWSLKRKAQMFTSVFGRKVRVRLVGEKEG